jgi:hypothetical protein
MYTDAFFKDKMSARGNTCAQQFVTSERFVTGKPMQSKANVHDVLEFVCRRYGVPKVLVSDRAKEETLGFWGQVVKQNLIPQSTSEPQLGWQNRCESEMREFRKHFHRIMMIINVLRHSGTLL